MLLEIFADDEHAAGWPYPRLLKIRKWLLVSCSLAIGWAHYRLDDNAIERLLGGIAAIDRSVLASVILLPLAILSVQFAILLCQHLMTADVVFSDRIAALRSERVTGLISRLEEARSRFTEALSERDEAERKAAALEEIIRHGLKDNSNARTLKGRELYEYARNLVNNGDFPAGDTKEWRQALSDRIILEDRLSSFHAKSDEVTQHLQDVEAEHAKATARDPASRRGFLAMEIAMDIVRLGPTAAITLFAWSQVARAALAL